MPRLVDLACMAGVLLPLLAPSARGQVAAPAPASAPAPVQGAEADVEDANERALLAIEEEFEKDLDAAHLKRFEKLVALAAEREQGQAGLLTEALLEYAIADGLFTVAEPVADRVIALGAKATPNAWLLARMVGLIAKVDRGAFKESVESLRGSLETSPEGKPGDLDPALVVSLLEVYYQRLLQEDQFEIAREALGLIRQKAQQPAVQDYLDQRLARLATAGQPAPAIAGTTLDGKPFQLADLKGKVVLVAFWASWCLPSAEQADDFVRVYQAFHDQGYEVVGINLDTLAEDGGDLATVMPNIKRFVLDYNLPWPNLVNGQGPQDHASAYKISDLPATVLIDREGKIRALDPNLPHLAELIPVLLGPGK